jgi:hypothetical protein
MCQQVQSNGGWKLSRWITCVVVAEHQARVPMHAFSNRTVSVGTFLLAGKETCEDGNLTAGMTLGRAKTAVRGCHVRCRFDCRLAWPCPNASVQKTTTLAQALSLLGQLTRQGGTNCQHVCKHFIWPASDSPPWASFSMLPTIIAFQRSLRHGYGKKRSRTSRLLFFVVVIFFFFLSPNTGHSWTSTHQRTLKDACFCWVPVPYLTMSPNFCPCH